jgi:hypothetical protein
MNLILHAIEWMLLIGAPAAVVLVGIIRMKRKHDAEARRPFTDSPLRVAGQSSRRKADELFESSTEDLLFILIGPAIGLFYGMTHLRDSRLVGGVLFFCVVLTTAWLGFRLRRKLKESWNYRLGALGEQVVSRELDQLSRQDYRVFHDVQFEGWNIDHVVVGPRGVFAVETKTWRKPRKDSKLQARVVFDGEGLSRPGKKSDRKAIEQARNNARSLENWILKAAAEHVSVVPVVALPGWALEIRRYGDVAVYSATNMSDPMINRGKSNLQPEQVQRIAFQLAKRCAEDLA